jgi:hypothetical protein
MRRLLTPASLALAAAFAAWLAWLITLPPRPSNWLVFASGLPLLALGSWLIARRSDSAWPAFVRDTADVHALMLVLLYALGVQFEDTHGISVDGVTYFAQLRSVVFDHDLDVTREFGFLQQPPRPNHIVPLGPIVVWLPLYLAVAAIDALGRTIGVIPPPADPVSLGLGLPFVRAAVVSSFAIGSVGLVALHWLLRARFARGVALAATVLVFGATPLYWYMVYEPSMTHAASFGFVALFVAASAVWVPRGVTVREAVVLGVLIGLAFMARTQEALFAVFPGVLVLSGAGRLPDRVRAALRLAGWALAGALPLIVIQLSLGYVLFVRYEYTLWGASGYLNLSQSRWAATLFSSWHGFLSWTPVAYVAVAGTVAYLRRDWRWAASALGILVLTAWVNGATQDWGGWSFGGRRFTSSLVMLAPGLALVIDAALRRPALMAVPILAAALWWNHLLMVQYAAGLLPKDEPVSFGRIVRQQAELHTRAPYFYPFAFPANLWFAWREGLPIDKYDLLAPEPAQTSIDLVFDKRVERFLLDGWDVPGGDEWGSCWWIGGTPATLALRLAPGPGRELSIDVQTRSRFEEPPLRASLALEVNGREIGRFAAGVPEATTATFTVPAADVPDLIRHGYNRLSFRSLGVEKVDPADPRPPGPLASRRGNHVWPVAIYRIVIK